MAGTVLCTLSVLKSFGLPNSQFHRGENGGTTLNDLPKDSAVWLQRAASHPHPKPPTGLKTSQQLELGDRPHTYQKKK